MKVRWALSAAELPPPGPRQMLDALRESTWRVSAQGSRLVHRLSIDREVHRALLNRGMDSSWLSTSTDEDSTRGNEYLRRYTELLAATRAPSSRYSMVRSGHLAKWGPYYCVLPPRRITVSPHRQSLGLIVSMEPHEAARSRLSRVGISRLQAWGLSFVVDDDCSAAYPFEQGWLELLQWPTGLTLDSPEQGRTWLTSQLKTAIQGGQSITLEGGSFQSTAGTLAGFSVVSPGGRAESLDSLFNRPARFWGGFPVDDRWVALSGLLRESDQAEPKRVVLILEKEPVRRQFLVCRVRPFYRMLVFAILGGIERSSVGLRWSVPEAGVAELRGDALRSASGPLLSWLSLISDGFDQEARAPSSVRIPVGLAEPTRALLRTHGIRSEGLQA